MGDKVYNPSRSGTYPLKLGFFLWVPIFRIKEKYSFTSYQEDGYSNYTFDYHIDKYRYNKPRMLSMLNNTVCLSNSRPYPPTLYLIEIIPMHRLM